MEGQFLSQTAHSGPEQLRLGQRVTQMDFELLYSLQVRVDLVHAVNHQVG